MTLRFASARAVRVVALAALCGVAATLAACGSSTEPKKDITPATITTAVTDTLRAAAGGTVNTLLSVTVKNAEGVAVPSIPVTFTVTAGGGSLAVATVNTDTNGVATDTWTLGHAAGVQTVAATVTTLAPVVFVAVAQSGTATTIAKVAGDSQTVTVGTAVLVAPSVKVTDQFGNPVSGVQVTFAAATGGGLANGAVLTTNASGVATVASWTLGATAGANTLTATAQGISTPVTFTATATAGALAVIKFTNTAPAQLTIGQTFKYTIQAFDAHNNAVSTAGIAFSSSNSAVATVDSTGTVTAVGAGSAAITASLGTISVSAAAISVLGHPSATIIDSVAMGSTIGGIVVSGNTAWVARSTASAVAAVNLTTGTLVGSADLASRAVDVAAGGSGPTVAAISTGSQALVWFVNAATLTRTDSIELVANPAKIAMTSTGTTAFVDGTDFNLLTIDVASRSITGSASLPGTVTVMKVAPGDTLLYAGTVFGTVYEVDARTGTVRRQVNTGASTIVDLDVSRDGKTLYTADGSTAVTMTPLASGGLSGTVDFGHAVAGVAISPDQQQLWASLPGLVVTAPFQNGTFSTIAVSNQHVLTGDTPTRIVFTALGDRAAVVDIGNLQIIVFK
jgi:adhesin/invasin